MNHEQLKQEAIKKAYGEYWGKVKDEITEDLFVPYRLLEDSEGITFDFQTMHIVYGKPGPFVRPIILRGIETNNGWIKIEEDGSNLPKEKCVCFLFNKRGDTESFAFGQQAYFGSLTETEYILKYFTHYQPTIKPQYPIY